MENEVGPQTKAFYIIHSPFPIPNSPFKTKTNSNLPLRLNSYAGINKKHLTLEMLVGVGGSDANCAGLPGIVQDFCIRWLAEKALSDAPPG